MGFFDKYGHIFIGVGFAFLIVACLFLMAINPEPNVSAPVFGLLLMFAQLLGVTGPLIVLGLIVVVIYLLVRSGRTDNKWQKTKDRQYAVVFALLAILMAVYAFITYVIWLIPK